MCGKRMTWQFHPESRPELKGTWLFSSHTPHLWWCKSFFYIQSVLHGHHISSNDQYSHTYIVMVLNPILWPLSSYNKDFLITYTYSFPQLGISRHICLVVGLVCGVAQCNNKTQVIIQRNKQNNFSQVFITPDRLQSLSQYDL